MIKCVGVRWQLFSDQQWFVSPRATSLSSGLFIVNGGKGLEHITIVLYLKLIKATYVQVCWLFGANFSPTSSFLSSPSNFRAAGLLLKTEGKGWSRSQLYFIWNSSKLLMFKFVGCLVPTFLQPPVFWARLQILERQAFYWKRRERAGADHNCTLFETYQSYLCSSLLAIWWQLFWNLQFSELVSNFRAAGLLLKTEKKGCSSLRLWFIWNTSKLLL